MSNETIQQTRLEHLEEELQTMETGERKKARLASKQQVAKIKNYKAQQKKSAIYKLKIEEWQINLCGVPINDLQIDLFETKRSTK